MSRRVLSTLVLATLAVLPVAACSGGDAGTDGGPVKIVFRQFDPPTQIAGLTKAVDAWNASHPDVQVEMQTLTDASGAQQFAREANSGTGPDVVQIANTDVKDLAKPKILLPLEEVMKDTPADPPIDNYLSLDLVQFEGKTWALPWTVDTFSLGLDPDLLEKAGVQTPTTWEEFAQVATKLSTKDRAGFCFPAGSAVNSGQWFPINYYLWSHGATLIKDDGGRWVVGATEADLTKEIDYFNGLFASGATPRSFIAVDELTSPQILDGLANGSCAMTFLNSNTLTNVRAKNTSIVAVPAPDGLMDGATHLGGRSLGINASTDHPAQAWQFVEYLNSEQAFTTLGSYPASKDLLEAVQFPAEQAGYKEQLPHAQSFARYTNGPIPVATLKTIVNSEFGAVYSGQKDSAAAARSIIERIDAELARQ